MNAPVPAPGPGPGLGAELETLYRVLPDLCFRVSADTTILDFRSGIGLDPYLPPEDFVGRRMSEVLPEPAASLCAAEIGRVAAEDVRSTVEYALPYPNGEERHFEARLACIEPGQVLVIVREITERVRAFAALRASEQRFRDFAETAADWFWEIDTEQRFTYIGGGGFERVIGIPASEIIGQTMAEVLRAHPNDPREIEAHLAELARGRPFRGVEVNWTNPVTGTTHRLSRSGVPILDADGRVVGHRGATTDITERYRLEAQLRMAQKMEAIGELAGGIAHDFNNILGTILGYSGLALDRHGDTLSPDVRRHLEEVRRAGRRGRDLVTRILAYARGVPGKARLVEPGELVLEACDLFESMLPSTLVIEHQYAPDLPAVEVDPVQIGQVMLTFAINARDAIESTGHLWIRAEHRRVAGACASCHAPLDGEYVAIEVEDDGRGIAPQMQHRVFEPFFTTRDVGEGTGLGLAMAHGVVHEQGGHLTLDSVPGRGTRIAVLLEGAASADP